jgi:hypothetical protein
MGQMIGWFAAIGGVLAVFPAAVFFQNLFRFRLLPPNSKSEDAISVLIPARNEERRIGDALRSLLRCRGVNFEIVVLDDNSTDRTAEIVRDFAAYDSRIRLESGLPVAKGWTGKNFACYQLASHARHSTLLFFDADVRAARPDALARIAREMERVPFLSGFPWQGARTFFEKLIVPLIHFVLLSFLPIKRMRRTTDPRFAAACGQLIAVRRDVYQKTGGHAAIAESMHDGLMLARNFRFHGYGTDIFDATDSFSCRMYANARDVWNGFGKNAQEGLGSPALIGPSTIFLLGGQVLPFLIFFATSSEPALGLAGIGAVAALVPRLVSAVRFRQPMIGAILHPVGVFTLLIIQWIVFLRSLGKRAVYWRGRYYVPLVAR